VNRYLRRLLGATALVAGLTGAQAGASAMPVSSVSIACNDVGALDAAITAANGGGPSTILLAHSCVYKLTSVASSDDGLPEVTGTVHLVGFATTIARVSGPSFTILEVNGGDLTVSGITLTGGSENEGGCVEPEGDGTLLLTNVAIHNCTAGIGGGIYAEDASVTIVGSHIASNSASDGGGIYITDGADVQILGSTVAENLAEFGGGVYLNDGTLLLRNSAVYRNTAFVDGGGLFNGTSPTNVTIVNSMVASNVPDNCEPIGTIVGCHF
jgi:hypothetical protein